MARDSAVRRPIGSGSSLDPSFKHHSWLYILNFSTITAWAVECVGLRTEFDNGQDGLQPTEKFQSLSSRTYRLVDVAQKKKYRFLAGRR
jgi:hypothetical protein